jgi:hypothetical protein
LYIFHLYEKYRIGRFIETERDEWFPEARKSGNGKATQGDWAVCLFAFK